MAERGRRIENAERDTKIFALIYRRYHKSGAALASGRNDDEGGVSDGVFAQVARRFSISAERAKTIYRTIGATPEGRRIKAEQAMRMQQKGFIGRPLPPRRVKEREVFARDWEEGLRRAEKGAHEGFAKRAALNKAAQEATRAAWRERRASEKLAARKFAASLIGDIKRIANLTEREETALAMRLAARALSCWKKGC
jgi:hypothetical protein